MLSRAKNYGVIGKEAELQNGESKMWNPKMWKCLRNDA